ncbi:hypothetical protein PLICRDRAFT_115563 [Plicaturopsis crispa FD-325 SS-3]|nr:hypothetical protein PLICRDRAFT_115563 [Plicaturopsis crispa FD-325 SS-3]
MTPNPWQEDVPAAEQPGRALHTPDPSTLETPPEWQEHREHTLHTPDPSTLDISSDSGPAPIKFDVRADEELLHEFDPLADEKEREAKEAWAHAESHPPPAPVPIPVPSTPEPPPTVPSSSPPKFPSLAALARTFSLPRQRPVSLDTATAVPSPATLSSFATLQDDGSRPSSGASSPRPGGGKGKEPKDPSQFDFQSFLEQMKLKGAEPVAKYLRSFLSNFAKRTFTVNDQVKIINDFLSFISGRMRETDVWRAASDAEFDNAMEGMEKLVMNRLYDFTFTPQVVRVIPARPVTADDLERDRVLSQRIALFTWIEEKHLDIPEGEGSKGFLMFAQQELLKINHYKAPRDKLICVLNCCKVIFGLIRHLKTEEGADSFVPILIFVVLKANPEHLLSNVEFINRFRNPEKLQSEAGYYLSSLMGAVSFIETMDHTSLSNITQEEFEKNVEDAIQSLPEEPATPSTSSSEPSTPRRSLLPPLPPSPFTPTGLSQHAGEESAQPLALPAPNPGPGASENARRLLQKTGDTISKPLSAIKQIFSEALDGAEGSLTYLPGPFAPFESGRESRQQEHEKQRGDGWTHSRQGSGLVPQTPLGVGEAGQQVGSYGPPIQTPYKPRVRRIPSTSSSAQSSGSAAYQMSPENTPTRYSTVVGRGPPPAVPPRVQSLGQSPAGSPHISRTATPNLDFAGMQAEIDHAHDKAAVAARETLLQIFPGTDLEVVEWVLEANEGDLGKSIEALLEMSSGT